MTDLQKFLGGDVYLHPWKGWRNKLTDQEYYSSQRIVYWVDEVDKFLEKRFLLAAWIQAKKEDPKTGGWFSPLVLLLTLLTLLGYVDELRVSEVRGVVKVCAFSNAYLDQYHAKMDLPATLTKKEFTKPGPKMLGHPNLLTLPFKLREAGGEINKALFAKALFYDSFFLKLGQDNMLTAWDPRVRLSLANLDLFPQLVEYVDKLVGNTTVSTSFRNLTKGQEDKVFTFLEMQEFLDTIGVEAVKTTIAEDTKVTAGWFRGTYWTSVDKGLEPETLAEWEVADNLAHTLNLNFDQLAKKKGAPYWLKLNLDTKKQREEEIPRLHTLIDEVVKKPLFRQAHCIQYLHGLSPELPLSALVTEMEKQDLNRCLVQNLFSNRIQRVFEVTTSTNFRTSLLVSTELAEAKNKIEQEALAGLLAFPEVNVFMDWARKNLLKGGLKQILVGDVVALVALAATGEFGPLEWFNVFTWLVIGVSKFLSPGGGGAIHSGEGLSLEQKKKLVPHPAFWEKTFGDFITEEAAKLEPGEKEEKVWMKYEILDADKILRPAEFFDQDGERIYLPSF